ncbi:MAG: hypothetical protein EU532_00495 [Promethearchaeota archaeon]|nr:MAG: hypothetical protein EU532_00495 [Candidatus Lokiarchaeota archaeon]
MPQIQIRCPSCHKNGIIEIDANALKAVTSGLLAINVESKTICEHSFITYVDRNLKIRDYFIADFQFEIPQTLTIEKIKEEKIPESEILNIDLIKLNLPANLVTFIIKSILLKKRILILLEEEFLHNQVINFFKYITLGAFNLDISIISKMEYNQNSKIYKNFMVFDGVDIIKNINKGINPKKLAIEKQIVHNFFSEDDSNSSLILLRNDIQKAYVLSKSIVDIINNLKKDEKINILKISKEIEESYSIKLSNMYLDFLIEIVKNYFEIDIPTISQSFLNSI